MNKKKKELIKKLSTDALEDLKLLNEEFEQIKSKGNKKKNRKLEEMGFIGDYELESLYEKRKDRKYAALTVELYALVEQLLKDIYKVVKPGDKYKNSSKKNVILDLEEKLKGNFTFENNTQLLANLRSHVVHVDFSLKKARLIFDKSSKSNKKLFKKLLNEVENYITKNLDC
ncbi:nucleoside-diphosphate sugar epimerase [Lysinibacillus sp. FSL W8-0992]|uniref:nucleoside-diphosphate sugar epimerase n=1 Tax=Lysinibacillus sp. FSL W8-0992 TaxID=2954643 RepID=UPI0030F831AC